MDKDKPADPMLHRRGNKKNGERELSLFEKLRFPIFREKFFHTVWICWAFAMLGWVEGLAGPTFPDLRAIINEDLDTASWLFTATPAGFLVGSVITGILYEKYNKLLLLVCSILGAAGATAAVPWCRYFFLMIIVKFVYGMLSASLDTGGNSEVVQTWGKDVGPYMQSLHFCFALGGMISPLVAGPFLAEKGLDLINDTSILVIENVTDIANNIPKPENSTTEGNFKINEIEYINKSENVHTNVPTMDATTQVHYAYLITAILTAITSLPFIVMYYMKQNEKHRTTQVELNQDPTNFKDAPIYLKLLILALLSSLMFLYCGTEDTYAGFLMTFCISQLNWSKSSGSFATSVHWICFGFTRLAAIYFVRFIRTSKLLYIFSILMVISFSCLLVSSFYNIVPLIWIFIGLSGLSMSVVFPAIFTWTNATIMAVSGRISAMFLTSASLGVMLFPLLFGYMMKRFSSMWFIYLLVGQSALWVFLYTITILLTRIALRPRPMEVTVEVEDTEMTLMENNKHDHPLE